MKYRKKAVVIEAIQFLGPKSVSTMEAVWGKEFVLAVSYSPPKNELLISSLEGLQRGKHSDWVVRGIVGEFYFVKPNIFSQTYEAEEEIEEIDLNITGNRILQ